MIYLYKKKFVLSVFLHLNQKIEESRKKNVKMSKKFLINRTFIIGRIQLYDPPSIIFQKSQNRGLKFNSGAKTNIIPIANKPITLENCSPIKDRITTRKKNAWKNTPGISAYI